MRPVILSSIIVLASGLSSYAEGPTFDAASVKMADPNARPPFTPTGGPGTSDPARFTASREAMVTLLERAFDVKEDQISGPAWFYDLPTSRPDYAITATMAPDTTKEQFQTMLQNLLIERFHLVFHRETRKFSGYELVVDNGGPKFKEVTPSPAPASAPDTSPQARLARPRGEDGFPVIPGSTMISQQSPGGAMRWKYQERTIEQFLSNLPTLILSSEGKDILRGTPRPRIVDRTGLAGRYTFILEFYNAANPVLGGALIRRGQAPAPTADPGNASPPAASDPGSSLPNIFAAIQKQLGLRLDKTADVPLDVIVIDSVDKTPTPN